MRPVPGRETDPARGGLPPRADDRGSALIMAIVMVTVVCVAIGGALSYAGTSLKASAETYQPSRRALYAADAAVKTGLAYVASNPGAGEAPGDGTPCRPPLPWGTVDGKPVTVEVCANTSTSFATSGRPKYTLLALASGTEPGLTVTSSGYFYVTGNLYSNTSIDSRSGITHVDDGDVLARTGCNGTVEVDPGRVMNCSVATRPADAVDPGYAPAATTAPPAATGSCDASTRIATLQAGTWSSAAAIDAAIGSCTFVHMRPGVHHLDNFAPNAPWTIRTKVVAGTLNGSIATSPIPGGCDLTGAGAQLITGGTTSIVMGSGGSLQVCGITTNQNGTSVRIPFYGPTRDWVSNVDTRLNGTTATATTSTFATPANALAIDGASTSYGLPNSNGTATLTVSGIGATNTIPAGTAISVAVAGSAGTTSNLTQQVRVTSTGGSTCTKTLNLGTTLTNATTVVPVPIDCTGFTAVAPLTVAVTATNTRSNGGANTITIDGVEVRYTAAGTPIRAQSGCVVTVGGCDVLSTSGTGRDVWLGGVVYTPLARLTLKVPNTSTAVISQALIARSLAVNATASARTDPIIGSDAGQRSNGDVTVTANVDGVPWVSSRTTYAVNGTTITPTLVSWVVRR